LAILALVALAPALAQETTSYTYDARGQLVTVNHGTTGPNANVVSNYTYDPAENRCAVNITTSGSGSAAACSTLTLSPATLPGGTIGTIYSKTITASGGTGTGYSFSVSSGSLPTGLNLSSTGSLSGTPTAAGSYSFWVKAVDSGSNAGSQPYSMTIAHATLSVTPTTLPNGTVGTIYTRTTIQASGGTGTGYTFAMGSGSPPGLTLNSSGLLSGTPTTAGTFTFTVTATDSAGDTGTRSYTVTIAPSGPCVGVKFTIASNGAVTEGAYSVFTITQSGSPTGNCSVSYATSDGTAVAPGDYTAASGTLTFTPAQATQTVSVKTNDDSIVESAETFNMTLSNPTGSSNIGIPGSATATINDNDASQPTPVNDVGSQAKCTTVDYNVVQNDTDPGGHYPLSLVSVTPSSFTIVSSTTIEYTSTLAGTYTATYTVQNSIGATANATLTVTVSGGICTSSPAP
jgi:hypothetical protein